MMNQAKDAIIRQTKEEILKDIDKLLKMIDNNDVVDCAEKLRETELKIVAATDKIAGKLIGAVVTNAVREENLISEGQKLAKSSPVRLKNHGKRDVVIHPYRGDPFSIKTTYYCRAGVLPINGSEKKGSIRS
jgi:hypothetical protein